MSIVINGPQGHATLRFEGYRKEEELEQILQDNPGLIIDPGEPDLAFVAKQVTLLNAGRIDLLFVSADGEPIIVEVKLAKNPQSRREILGQVLDYVSSLALYTVDELNQLVAGRLKERLIELADDSSSRLEELWSQCGTNLRAGQIKMVLAVDEASEDLIRIVSYINDHSDIDIRLVAIRRYVRGADTILVPNILIRSFDKKVIRPVSTTKAVDRYFQAVLDAYAKSAEPEFIAKGGHLAWRPIRHPKWPRTVHYEIIDKQEQISLEIHLESAEVKELALLLKQFMETLSDDFPGITWDPTWFDAGRLFILFEKEKVKPEQIAAVVKKLVELTHSQITASLNDYPMCRNIAIDNEHSLD